LAKSDAIVIDRAGLAGQMIVAGHEADAGLLGIEAREQ